MGKLAGKAALVTGAAGGIGQAIARRYRDEGAVVALADLSLEAAETTARAIGEGTFAVPLDVTREDSIADAVATVRDRAGRIDVLVNNAGVFDFQPWLQIESAAFDRVFAINVRGLMLTTQAVARVMIEAGGGAIVNMASGAGRRGNPLTVAYSASKATVISLTQSAALAFAGAGIRVNAIAPGGVATSMWDEVDRLYSRHAGAEAGTMTRDFVAKIPLGRMSTPDDYLATAVFLASDDSAYVTGQTLNVDGGLFLN